MKIQLLEAHVLQGQNVFDDTATKLQSFNDDASSKTINYNGTSSYKTIIDFDFGDSFTK